MARTAIEPASQSPRWLTIRSSTRSRIVQRSFDVMNQTAPATIGFGLFLVLLLAVGSGVLTDLIAFSRGNPTASHVVLIPFVTLALIVREREHIFISIRPAVR